MIVLEVEGEQYSNFDDITVRQSMDEVSGTFFFSAFSDSKEKFPFKAKDKCRLLIDEIPVITGNIDRIKRAYNTERHVINITGRDKTADIVDSSLGEKADFNGTGLTLKNVIQLILNLVNSKLKIIDNVNDNVKFKDSEKISARIGQSPFDVIQQYARKRQTIVTSNGDGDIVLTRGEGEEIDFTLFNLVGKPENNNIKSAIAVDDVSKLFSKYTFHSQGNVSGMDLFSEIDNATITNANGESLNPDIRDTRIFNRMAEQSSDSDQCKKRAEWQNNINRVHAFTYDVVVQGFTYADKKIWQFNKIVNVEDDMGGVHGQFLIKSVKFNQSIKNGSTTELGIVVKDAYTTEPIETKKIKRLNKKDDF